MCTRVFVFSGRRCVRPSVRPSVRCPLTLIRSEEFFTPCGEQITRGYPFKLRLQHCRIDARKYFFSSRVITIWNQLPAGVLMRLQLLCLLQSFALAIYLVV